MLALPAALACGLHDGPSFQRGAMNWIYPNSLHVGTQVWMAQRAGRLESDAFARRDDLTIEARNRYEYLQAKHWLRQLQARLAGPSKRGERPNIAVVLLGPMLWSRYQASGSDVTLAVHVEGPAEGDVVVVTEPPVIKALAYGRLTVHEALELGVIRFYGKPAISQAAVEWFRR